MIVRYLAATYGAGSFWPVDAGARGVADQWMEWAKTSLYGAFIPVFLGLVRTPEGERDMGMIHAGVKKTGEALAILEGRLGGCDFVGGDVLTMGDMPFGPLLYRYFNLPIERPCLPNVERWYARMSDRAAFRQHVMVPFGGSLAEWLALEKAGA